MADPISDPDAALVTSTLVDRMSLCSDCIARRLRISPFRVEDAAQRLSTARKLISETARCNSCRVRALVHRLA